MSIRILILVSKSVSLLLLAVLAACGTQDALWAEQRVQERYEALTYACRQAGGVIQIDRHSAIRSKLDLPPTRWEMATAKCVTLY